MADADPTTPPPTQPPADPGAMVPSSRLREATERAQAAESALQAAQAQLQALTGERETWSAERSVYRAGITDPEGVAVATFLHGQLPAEGRPEIGDWISSVLADGGSIPRALAGYVQRPAAPPAAPPAPAAAPVAPPAVVPPAVTSTGPAPTTTTTGAGASSSGYDESQIRAIRQEAARTGDLSKLRAAMPDIMKAVTAR